ncbi:unnamed protein product [Protopolystoma xenopodis]|uniref:Uncharacterized protein n=1 Tax=Protopolystoma xenopodis TaxID=117903 RepID=A0A448WCJ6_9PLAT|nr:unnamed protein product [Protopolystoma xenopodis]
MNILLQNYVYASLPFTQTRKRKNCGSGHFGADSEVSAKDPVGTSYSPVGVFQSISTASCPTSGVAPLRPHQILSESQIKLTTAPRFLHSRSLGSSDKNDIKCHPVQQHGQPIDLNCNQACIITKSLLDTYAQGEQITQFGRLPSPNSNLHKVQLTNTYFGQMHKPCWVSTFW